MADISKKITKKSLKAKKKYAIRTIKKQAKEKIRQVKIEYAENPALQQEKLAARMQRKALRQQKQNARLSYNARQPREFTLGEDLFNSISHGIGAGLSVAAIVLLVIKAYFYSDAALKLSNITSFAIFGSSLFIVYMMSTLYHALTPYGARKVFSILGHIAIYILIAGTITPFLVVMNKGAFFTLPLIILWLFIFFCIALYGIFKEKIRSFSFFTYIAIGWIFTLTFTGSSVGAFLGKGSRAFLLASIITYSSGFLFYLMRRYKWTHSIFHLCALAGSILSFFSVFFLLG